LPIGVTVVTSPSQARFAAVPLPPARSRRRVMPSRILAQCIWAWSPSWSAVTSDGCPKRWVVVRPPGAETGLLLARADGADQAAIVGKQAAGRVGFFLQVADFGAAYARMTAAGVEFLTAPRTEPYGQVAVFRDVAGNKWDLIGPG